MSIWFNKEINLDQLNAFSINTMNELLGIRITEIGENFLRGTMPVDRRTHQAYGILHGGASAALAETLGSIGSILVVDMEKYICVGVEINANHIRSAKDGWVTGTAIPLHLGSSSHVWEIKITDNEGKLVCASRLTVFVKRKKQSE